MQLTLAVFLSVVAAAVSVGVAVFSWRRRETAGAVPLAAFTAATTVWTAGNALQAASVTLSAKLFWVNVQYVGIGVVPIAWFAFACEYTDREEWVSPRTLVALAVYPAITLGLVWTNDYHHLVRATSEVVTVGDVAVLRRTFGAWFWTSVVYSNLVNGVGTVLLLHELVRSRRLYRRQTVAILTGATVPWAAAVLFYNGLSPVEPEVFFSVTGMAFAYAIAQYEFLDVTPVGRHAVVEEMDDCVLVLDAEDRIVDANPAAGRLFGWASADDAIGRPITAACASCPNILDWYAGDEKRDHVSVVGEDGECRHFDVRRSSLSNRSASVVRTTLILRDVTEQKRNEERLEHQNERLERVGRAIAHDLRNPLNVAHGNLDLARESADDAVVKRLDSIDHAHDRMDDIIDEVLTMAQSETSNSADSVALRGVAENAWANVATGDATLAFDDGDVPMVADVRQLTSVFENLFQNAVEHGSTSHQASPADAVEHGSASNRATSNRAKRDAPERDGSGVTVRVGTLDENDGFFVADDGPGIPEAERKRVFDDGYTTQPDGIGVGLATVADIADGHGWNVVATESEGGGARFEIRGVEVGK